MPKPCAYSLIRPEPHYRRDAFAAGLEAVGYEVRHETPARINAGDVVVSWNRYSNNHDICKRVEQAGGVALIAENGFIGVGGVSPHSMKVRDPYALARGYHNDSSVIPEGGPERWGALGVNLKPWRASGGHVLICQNRPFGTPGRAMSPDWPSDVKRRLSKLTVREIRMRPHPGNDAPKKPLAEDLAGAWALVIWASSAGVHSLVAGVPVICEAPFWICKRAAGSLDQIESPSMPDRLPVMQRLAWAQFHLSEIASGFAFASLLRGKVEIEIGSAA